MSPAQLGPAAVEITATPRNNTLATAVNTAKHLLIVVNTIVSDR
jgi:hypothetical protein